MGKRASGVAWYTREHYEEIRALMVDGHLLPSTFDEWLECAERVVARIERSGMVASKVAVLSHDFDLWCRLQGYQRDAEARCEFVRLAVREGRGALWTPIRRRPPEGGLRARG